VENMNKEQAYLKAFEPFPAASYIKGITEIKTKSFYEEKLV